MRAQPFRSQPVQIYRRINSGLCRLEQAPKDRRWLRRLGLLGKIGDGYQPSSLSRMSLSVSRNMAETLPRGEILGDGPMHDGRRHEALTESNTIKGDCHERDG